MAKKILPEAEDEYSSVVDDCLAYERPFLFTRTKMGWEVGATKLT